MTARKPKDPRMRVHVPHAAGTEALKLIQQTFGPHAPAPIQALVEALGDGIARHADAMGRKRPSRFAELRVDAPLTFETATPAHAHRIKASAHKWAEYHGARVATRTHPNGSAVTVYLMTVPR